MLHDQKPALEGAQANLKVILIVEDDPDLGEALVYALSHKPNYRIFLATDGFAALKFVRHIKPHLFILKHRLPKMNGYVLYHRLHALRELEAIPAFLVSTNLEDDEGAMENCKLMALSTPLHLDSFLSLVEGVLA